MERDAPSRERDATFLAVLEGADWILRQHDWWDGRSRQAEQSYCLKNALSEAAAALFPPARGSRWYLASDEASRFLLKLAGRSDLGRHAEAWNDARGRTKEEVLGLLALGMLTLRLARDGGKP